VQFRRALLLREDQLLFDELWNKAEFHIPAAEKAAHPLPMVTVLMSMNLEQEKTLFQLEEKNRMQDQEIRRLRERLEQDEQQMAALRGEVDRLYAEIEHGMKKFRAEMLDTLYPAYAS
jgi:DNA-binding transcriptional regulator YiaG